ncbi:putative ATP-grasp-modified RiPP [Streptomyces sp. NPDC057638]|uniref:putative ATP-grasp-modified RiPP n=1 Tax=Streptomyces sp. NPDC057638 TaxID=3346190 RepID=UPI0036BE7921
MSTLAPSMFPKPENRPGRVTAHEVAPVRPFGVTLALPVTRTDEPEWTTAVAYCPDRQLTVTAEGELFIHAPSMKSAFKTVAQTQEDMQRDEEKANDTD